LSTNRERAGRLRGAGGKPSTSENWPWRNKAEGPIMPGTSNWSNFPARDDPCGDRSGHSEKVYTDDAPASVAAALHHGDNWPRENLRARVSGAQRFTEEEENAELAHAGGAPWAYRDRSGVALGVDTSVAFGTGGGKDDREPPPSWSRTHAHSKFADALD
jgi:hypothetical protein